MDREARYLCIPHGYCDRLGGLRWSNTGDAVEFPEGGVFAFGPQIALFLQGFLTSGRLPHFGYLLHLLNLLVHRQCDESAETQELIRAFIVAGRRLRNAGALCAFLCREVPPVPGAIDGQRVCSLLGNSVLIQELRIRWLLEPQQLPETLPLGPDTFELRVVQELRKLSLAELYHWLHHGCPPVQEAAKEVARALVVERPRTLAEVLEGLTERTRLEGAVPFVAQMVSALALPPRRLQPQQLLIGGYVDVTTRGHPEQILPSQFAVDDLEFVRRFAEKELLFFRREEPSAQIREELLLLLDQGVRTWGVVRLVLTAAVVAFARLAQQRKLPVLVAGTSTGGRMVNPEEVDESVLAELLEASDLTPHPGLALETVLEQPATAARDVVLLSHPRSLSESDVATAARRLQPGTRLFALTVNDQGQARLDEFRHGAPIKVRQFQVDMNPPARSRGDHAEAAAPESMWTGDVEPVGFPFRFGINSAWKTLHFDFDDASEWLLVASSRGLLHAFRIDGSAMEILPRGWVNGKPLTRVDVVLGVAGGFVVGGRMDALLVAIHYDFTARGVIAHVLDDDLQKSSRSWQWFYFPQLHAVVADCRDFTRAVDLATGGQHPPRAPYSRLIGTHSSLEMRAAQACVEAEKYILPPPFLLIAGNATGMYRGPYVALDPDTGTLLIHGLGTPWKPFMPLADGKPLLQGATLQQACYRGHVLALTCLDPVRHQWMLRLFRDGVPVGEYPGSARFTLSTDGRLLARLANNDDVEVRMVGDGGEVPLLVTPRGKSHHRVEVVLGSQEMRIGAGRWYHRLVWTSGRLEFACQELRPSSREISTWPGRRATARDLPACVGHDPDRFLTGIQADLLVAVDLNGQVAVFDRSDSLLCMFFIFRGSLAGWMPDGTRFGPASVIGGPPTAGALEKFGRTLRAASDSGGRTTS